MQVRVNMKTENSEGQCIPDKVNISGTSRVLKLAEAFKSQAIGGSLRQFYCIFPINQEKPIN